MGDAKYTILEFEYNGIYGRIITYLVIIISAFYLGNRNFLVYHTLVELHSIIIAGLIFIISVNTHRINKDRRMILLGIAYGFIACFDLMHMMTYKGMGIFADDTSNIPTQLWIAARYIESLSFLICYSLPHNRINFRRAIHIYAKVSLFLYISIFHLKIFPDCFVPDYGLTHFKIISEYVICGILIGSIIIFIKENSGNRDKSNRFLISALVATTISGVFFANYIDVYGLSSILGHAFKSLSYYYIYIALGQSSLQEPLFELAKVNYILDRNKQKLEEVINDLRLECDERKKAEAENARKTEVLEAILEASGNGIVVIDNNQKIIHTNKVLMDMWDISSQDVIRGKTEEFIEIIGNQLSNPGEFESFIKTICSEVGYHTSDLHLNNDKIIEISSLPFIDKGTSRGKVISFRDVTERNKVIELKKQVEIKQISLEKAKEFDELKTNFFSTVSHELRTPINIILGVIQLLSHIDNDQNTVKGRYIPDRYIAMIKQNCYRLIKLANNLIDITKIDSGYMKLELDNHNMVSIVEDIAMSVVEYSNMKGISLIFDTEIEELVTACDVNYIERIMLNLLSNAVKFSEHQGKIEVKIKHDEECVYISVKDDGVGIPKEMVENIFDRFKQVDSSLRREKEGSGIGLSIVKAMVEMHDGKITLESEIGEGTEFVIQLPIRRLDEDHIDNSEYPYKEVKIDKHVDKINIEFSDIYELNHVY